MLPLVVFPFLHMLNLDMHCEAFSHQLKLMPEAFNKHPGVAFNFLKSVM